MELTCSQALKYSSPAFGERCSNLIKIYRSYAPSAQSQKLDNLETSMQKESVNSKNPNLVKELPTFPHSNWYC